jgi:hypothetical protein
MLAVNTLPPEEILTLEEMHNNHPCHAPRIRAHAILLSDVGFKLKEIASIFNICRQTAATWLHAWKDGGIWGYLINHAVVVRLFCATKQKLMRLHVSINRQDH